MKASEAYALMEDFFSPDEKLSVLVEKTVLDILELIKSAASAGRDSVSMKHEVLLAHKPVRCPAHHMTALVNAAMRELGYEVEQSQLEVNYAWTTG